MSERRLPLRAQIRPFPREAHYLTGWSDPMTFADIRAALKHINYFFFKADADFPPRFADLFGIIRTDYAHKERHTTLELRAMEWERRGRDASFLLIENELKEAQDWLAAAPAKEPAPTALHPAYIEASTRRTRQLRNIRRAGVIGSGVALIAILFAVGARAVGAANAEVQAAEGRVQSLDLASEAISILSEPNGNAEISALLGIRALQAGDTGQANNVLTGAIDRSHGEVLFAGHTDDVYGGLILRDGHIVSWSSDSTLRLWRANGESLAILNGHRASVAGALELQDGRILSWSGDKTLRFWYVIPHNFIAYACTRVFRDFTTEERARYGLDDTPTCAQIGPIQDSGA